MQTKEAHLCGALREPVSLTRSEETPRSRTKRGSAIDARLHTAVSSGLVYSRISVHRLLHLIVPCGRHLGLKIRCSNTMPETGAAPGRSAAHAGCNDVSPVVLRLKHVGVLTATSRWRQGMHVGQR